MDRQDRTSDGGNSFQKRAVFAHFFCFRLHRAVYRFVKNNFGRRGRVSCVGVRHVAEFNEARDIQGTLGRGAQSQKFGLILI